MFGSKKDGKLQEKTQDNYQDSKVIYKRPRKPRFTEKLLEKPKMIISFSKVIYQENQIYSKIIVKLPKNPL